MHKGTVMSSVFRALLLLVSLCFAQHAFASCDPDGLQKSGSIYRICMPDGFSNGRLDAGQVRRGTRVYAGMRTFISVMPWIRFE